MDLFTYLLTAFVGFIGLYTGLLLAKFAPDEIQSFKRFIPFLQMILLITGMLVIFAYMPFVLSSVVFILSFLFIYLFWNKRDVNTLDYVIFSLLFFVSSLNLGAHYYMTAIIFVFGILSGTLFFVLHSLPNKHKRNYGHHKHSGKNMDVDEMSKILFHKYSFFIWLVILNYLIGYLFTMLI